MKNSLLLSIICVLSLQVQAQKISFTDTSNQWRVVDFYFGHAKIIGYSISAPNITVDSFTFSKLTSNNRDSILIRTDSTGQKIYARVYNGSIQAAGSSLINSNEHLLYDFSMQIGDTIQSNGFTNVLTHIDSVLISGQIHKVYFYSGGSPQSFENGYTVIEGIGCTRGLLYPLAPVDFEGELRLSCFKTKGTTPTMSKKVHSFDNDQSCHLSINEMYNTTTQVKIFPQPAHNQVTITLPQSTTGSISIINTTGQVVYTDDFVDTELLHINMNNANGIYYYTISDNNTNNVSNGKLSFY